MKQRVINTKFWDDNYIINLDPIEKLLFLYFLTNPLTDICGIYEITIHKIAFDTGVNKDIISKILNRFSTDDKIYYIDGWIYVKNFSKHQADNPSVKKGIERAISLVPPVIMQEIHKLTQAVPSLYTECGILKPKPEPKLKPNNTKVLDKSNPPLKENKSNPLIDYIINSLKEFQDIPTLDGTNKDNRQYAFNLIRCKIVPEFKKSGNTQPTDEQLKKGFDKVLTLIGEDKFHKSNSTSIKYIYNNFNKIINK